MAQRTENTTLRDLYLKLRDNMTTYEQFNLYRDRLMDPCPKNRERKQQKRGCYIRYFEGKNYVAFGLIAKLISGCFRVRQKKRLQEVNLIANELGLVGTINREDFIDGTNEQKKQWMRIALKEKFKLEPYKSYLLSTGDLKLYEYGKPGDWTGENGWLGYLIMETRDNLRCNPMKKIKQIIYKNIDRLYELILQPKFLEEHREEFTTEIENHLLRKTMDKNFKLENIYYTLIPLFKHFDGVEEQTFISDIKDRCSFQYALKRIKENNFQWYRPETISIRQSIPSEALVNSDGMSVGRGLKTSGNVVFRCLTCGIISNTEEEYWKHQEIHGNYKVRTFERKVLVNKYKF